MSGGLGARGLMALLLAVFAVALAYGIVLPLLPLLVVRAFGASSDVGLHTGLITGSYAFAIFLFAPMWGRWSDKVDRRRVLIASLCGFALAMSLGAAFAGEAGLYLSRFLGGAFAAGVAPVAQALVVDAIDEHQLRARHFAWIGMAGIAGLLAGPLIGGVAASAIKSGLYSLAVLQGGLALGAGLAAVMAALWLPSLPPRIELKYAAPTAGRQLAVLLWLSAVIAAGLGAFEVGVTLRGQNDPSLTSGQLGLVFAECMLVMAAAQALVFNRWVSIEWTARLIAPSLLVLGFALLLLPWTNSGAGLMLATGALAAAGGILLPVLAFWITLAAGPMQGRQLGRQTSAASLGQAVGSALAGFLAGASGTLNGGLLLTGAVLVMAAVWLLKGLPRLLLPFGRT
jgi:predicted MFS family arabinose efflux permease